MGFDCLKKVIEKTCCQNDKNETLNKLRNTRFSKFLQENRPEKRHTATKFSM